MGRPQQTFDSIRKRTCDRTREFLRSRPEGVVLADVRAFWRLLGSAGMADSVLAWLEQDGELEWDRASGVVMLTARGQA